MNNPKEIRFIDSRYNELFRIPDGGHITVTRPDGEERIHQCQYMDETHVSINGNCLHICQFAENMEYIGAKVEPEPSPQIIAGYRIMARVPVKNHVFALAHNPNAVQPYVTWQKHNSNKDYGLGHYFKRKSDAEADLVCRVHAERTDTAYKSPTEKKNQGKERCIPHQP